MTRAPTPAPRLVARSAWRLAPTLAVLALLLSCGAADAPPTRPHVIVWMVDTLRADHVSAYGYERPTTPSMDALAAGGALFEQLHTSSNWTQPSVATLLSGFDPPDFRGGFEQRCPPGLFMAAEALQLAGYQTAGLTMTVATAARFGFDQGFEVYRELDAEQEGRLRKQREGAAWDADVLVDAALALIDERAPDERRPLFLYLHSVDPHAPYESHAGRPSFSGEYDGAMDGRVSSLVQARRQLDQLGDKDRQQLLDLYDDEVAFNDAELGRLVAALEQRGLLEDTLLVVLADHGDEFLEHGDLGHGHANLHAELTRVPWILHWPAGLAPGQRVASLARGVDVLPTLLELAGVEQLVEGHGRSLASALAGPALPAAATPPRPERAYISRCNRDAPLLAVRTDERLLIWDPLTGTRRLYAWRDDPLEQHDLAALEPELTERLHADLRLWLVAREVQRGGDPVVLDPETRARLEALGYLR